jgi:hypothetical protein
VGKSECHCAEGLLSFSRRIGWIELIFMFNSNQSQRTVVWLSKFSKKWWYRLKNSPSFCVQLFASKQSDCQRRWSRQVRLIIKKTLKAINPLWFNCKSKKK